MNRCPFREAKDILKFAIETSLDLYVAIYLHKTLCKAHIPDIGLSNFYNDLFYWDHLKSNYKTKNLSIGHLLRLKRAKNLKQENKKAI